MNSILVLLTVFDALCEIDVKKKSTGTDTMDLHLLKISAQSDS